VPSLEKLSVKDGEKKKSSLGSKIRRNLSVESLKKAFGVAGKKSEDA
jgi:hypothetical protein